MGRAVKTFRVAEEDVEPIRFVFEFLPVDPAADPRVEEFEAYGKAPGGAMKAAMAVNKRDGRGRTQPDMDAFTNFFALSMPSEQFERLENLFNDPAWTIEFDTIVEVFRWLLEEQAERPTRRSRRSSRTGPDAGRTEHDAVIELSDNSVVSTSTN